MRKILTFAVVVLALMIVVGPSARMANEANLTNTTLAAAQSDARGTRVTIASNTGVTASNTSVPQTVLVIDDEIELVQSQVGTSSSTIYNVVRGYRGTTATPHNSSAVVIVAQLGNPQQVFDNFLRGSCVSANIPYLPRIVASAGFKGTKQVFYETCTGPLNAAIWRESTPLGDTTTGDTTVADVSGIGQTAYASIGTTTAGVSGTEYESSIFVPYTQVFTGLKVLQNATVGTDKMIGILRDASGNLLATSSLSGVATASASTFLTLPFTSTILLPGPARYFIGAQMGTTATDGMFLQATVQFVNTLTTSATGTFGTVPATFSEPTTFTTAKGPIAFLY